MKILAIDTAETACSAALLIDGEVRERFEIAPRRHSELILGMMQGLLDQADLSLGVLDALAFGRGPGSFTGLRIAAAVAQGTAWGADLPVVPVSNLRGLAQGVRREQGADRALAGFDARMGEVYWGAYVCNDAGLMSLQGEERVCAPGSVSAAGDAAWSAAGSAWATYPAELADALGYQPKVVLPRQQCHAHDLAVLAAHEFGLGNQVEAAQALPVYLRDEVAWKKA